MYRFEEFVSLIDHALNTKAKRHIAGGVLMSVSLLFGGLAITIMTIKEGENNELYIE